MITSHRTIQSLYQAAKLTNVIRITEEQFARTDELKNLQLYDFDGMEFFKACSQLWELNEDTGKFHIITPITGRGVERITYVTGAVAA